MKIQFAIAIFSLVPLACSSGDDNNDSGGGLKTLTVAEFYKARAELGCQRSFECCSSSSNDENIAQNNRQGATSEEECASAPMHKTLKESRDNTLKMVEDGTVVFHGDEAAACIAALAEITCRDMFNDEGEPDPEPCLSMFEGQIALGETCQFSSQCVGDAGCIGSTSAGYSCKTIPGPGDACTGYCPDGYYCSDANYCAEQLPEGTACDPYKFFQCQGICDINTSTCGPPLEFTPSCTG